MQYRILIDRLRPPNSANPLSPLSPLNPLEPPLLLRTPPRQTCHTSRRHRNHCTGPSRRRQICAARG